MKFFGKPRVLTPHDIARAQLLQAQKDRLHHKGQAEYHQAMVQMFEQRITRLKEDVATLEDAVTEDSDFLNRWNQFERQLEQLEDDRARKG